MASDDKSLGTFRIGDLRRPEVRGSGKTPQEAAAPAGPSVGFPAVESRLEAGSIESLADELRPSYEKLEAMASDGDMKQKAAAKKAMAAYERTADLFEYLYETKAALQQGR
ncbi:MAG: hypothetical protein IPG45_29160 [Deltaproteobacteria bacterium]|jgi:hypothetical protein|nr:hypothetical protein [Deltaproteobacteria bacterium]